MKNANSTWLNGRPLDKDLAAALGREVRVANDANCFAVSEATDGAAAGKHVVFGVILGTGCGGGVAIDGRVHEGPNGVARRVGTQSVAVAAGRRSIPGPACYCGKRGCMEMWVSGTGIALDYKNRDREGSGRRRRLWRSLRPAMRKPRLLMERFEDRLARGLAQVINILDPDVIVIGGGVSRVEHIYRGASEENCRHMCLVARRRRLFCRRSMGIRVAFAAQRGFGRIDEAERVRQASGYAILEEDEAAVWC